ncbi:MAG: sulfotransferase family 2 domain-containing protein [Alteromonadaceae bacterium]|nr:sulfotransferase family 2 domain-containing protein [Alteromonadaceae bacterium]
MSINSSNPIFFIHVPKTAGTSFRKSAEKFFGLGHVLYDYNTYSAETSDVIKDVVYDKKDFFLLDEVFSDNGCEFLSGHVPASKYVQFFGVANSVTFLRDPLQRIISEYYHFLRHHDYEGDLPSFYRKPQFINRQSRMLQGPAMEALGFVGITEEYDASLEQINAAYGIDLRAQVLNQGRESQDKGYDVPKQQLQEMRELNKTDMTLYDRAVELHRTRYELFLQKKPYVHGVVQQLGSDGVSGWAWYAQGDRRPVVVEIKVDGEPVGVANAADLRPGLLRFSAPRLGHVGFRFDFKSPLKQGAEVSVVVAETGQVIATKKVKAA